MDAFILLKLIILLIITVVGTVFGAVSYKKNQAASKKAASTFLSDAPPLRSLTAQEKGTLEPLLFPPNEPKAKPLSLDSEEVFSLQGAYSGFGMKDADDVWHDTIDGVEVVLPYDARLYLAENNQAEVVFAGKFAFVLRLNNAFELLEGEERNRLQEQNTSLWEAGIPEQFNRIEANPTPSATNGNAHQGAPVILEQRDETAAEVEQRDGRDFGLLAGTLWAVVLAGLFFSGSFDPPAAERYLLFAIAVFFSSRPCG